MLEKRQQGPDFKPDVLVVSLMSNLFSLCSKSPKIPLVQEGSSSPGSELES